MSIVRLIVVFVIAYFIGNISPAIILGKLKGIDIRKEGSGNAGTTNVLRVMGTGPAAITLLGDLLKAVIAVKVGFSFGGEYVSVAGMVCFAGVIIGHVFPVIYGFKGGKGVASGLGGALALNWLSAFAAIIVFAIAVGTSKKMSVGSIAAAIAYPFFVWFYAPAFLPVAIPAGLFIVINHIPNIKRLMEGTEPNISFGDKLNIKKKLSDIYYDPTVEDDKEDK